MAKGSRDVAEVPDFPDTMIHGHLEATMHGNRFEVSWPVDQRIYEMFNKWLDLASFVRAEPPSPPVP